MAIVTISTEGNGMSIEQESRPNPLSQNALVNFYLAPYPPADAKDLTYHMKNSGVDEMAHNVIFHEGIRNSFSAADSQF